MEDARKSLQDPETSGGEAIVLSGRRLAGHPVQDEPSRGAPGARVGFKHHGHKLEPRRGASLRRAQVGPFELLVPIEHLRRVLDHGPQSIGPHAAGDCKVKSFTHPAGSPWKPHVGRAPAATSKVLARTVGCGPRGEQPELLALRPKPAAGRLIEDNVADGIVADCAVSATRA